MQLAQAYEQLGDDTLALEALADATRLSGGNSKAVALRGYVFAKMGRTGEAQEVLNVLAEAARQRYVPATAFATVHGALGNADAMFDWLNKAIDAQDVHLIFLPVDAKWDRYRSDQRFAALLARCGFTR
jgi:tetratricopeptide (TPR) repeat protein